MASGAVVKFQRAMENDMCTPEAVAVMFHTLRQANLQLDAGYVSAEPALSVDTGSVAPGSDTDLSVNTGLSGSKSGSEVHVADAVFEMAHVLGLMNNATFLASDKPSVSDKSDGDRLDGDRLLDRDQPVLDRYQPAGIEQPDRDEEIEQIMKKRKLARRMKNWSISDALRDELAAIGVVVEDTADGSTWYRK